MNRNEAFEIAKSGKKLVHKYFLDYEYLEFKDGKLITEDGYDFSERFYEFDFFENDWSIFEEFNLE